MNKSWPGFFVSNQLEGKCFARQVESYKREKGKFREKEKNGIGSRGWGAGGGRPLLSLRMRNSCRNQSLNVLIVFLRSPVHHDRHRQSQDEDTDESAEASNQLRKELLKSESVAQQEVGANSAEINFFPFPRVCQRACQVEDWRRRGHCWTNSGVHEFPTLFSLLREGEKEENAGRRDGWAISVGGDVLGGFNTGASSPSPSLLNPSMTREPEKGQNFNLCYWQWLRSSFCQMFSQPPIFYRYIQIMVSCLQCMRCN